MNLKLPLGNTSDTNPTCPTREVVVFLPLKNTKSPGFNSSRVTDLPCRYCEADEEFKVIDNFLNT